MRLIDADKLLEGIAELKQSPWYNDERGYADRKEAVEAVRYLCIIKAPTVDAVPREKYEAREETRKILVEFADDLLAELKERVEVVRCGECKYMMADGRCYIFADDNIRPSVSDFCSYGERKEK